MSRTPLSFLSNFWGSLQQFVLDNFEYIFDSEEKIKNFDNIILQLAVSGKLNTQNPNDEPASELLKKINAEKEKLRQEGRSQTEKILPNIEKELPPFDIPENWKWVRLIDVTTFITDYQANGSFADLKENVKSYDIKNHAVLVRLKDLRKNLKATSDFIYTDKTGYEYLSKSSLKGGEILVANVGAGTGTTLIMPEINMPATIAPNMFIVYISEFINKEYFTYYCQSLAYWEQINKLAGGSAQPKMNKTEYRSVFISIPPLSEQKRIVEIVEKLLSKSAEIKEYLSKRDKKLVKLNQSALHHLQESKTDEDFKKHFNLITDNFNDLYVNQENLKGLRQTVLQLAVQGKLVPQNSNDEPASELLKKIKAEKEKLIKEGKIKKEKPLPPITKAEIPYNLPKNWECIKLGELGLINPRNYEEDEKEASFVPMTLIKAEYGAGHAFEKRLWKDIKSGFTHFAENDITVAKITPCFENGKSAVMKNLVNGFGAGTTELHVFRRVTEDILPEFILIHFKNAKFLKDGEQKMTGSAGQKRVPKDYICNYVVGLPSFEEQKRIVAKVDELMTLCDQLEEKINKKNKTSEALIQSVVHNIFNSKKEPVEV